MDSYMHSDMHLHTHSRPDILPRRSELYHIHPTSQRNPVPVQLPLTSTPQIAPTRSPTSCMPSALLDPGMDPSGVDFRNFFPYIPNEVKHRKRTSTEQAKVLEGIFTKNPKPDSKLRGRLAEELDMKPRGVQVWFQNRRAKEKLNSQKAQAASAQAERKAVKKKSLTLKEEPSTQPSSPPDNYSSPSSSRQASSSPESSPGPLTLDDPLPEVVPAPQAHDLSPKVATPATRQLDPPRPTPDLYSLRRGSLPNLMGSHTPLSRSSMGPPRPVVNQLARRGSVERLRRNPYASYVHTRPRPAPYRNRQTSLRESFLEVPGIMFEDTSRDAALAEAQDQHSALLAPGPSRRMLTHRASMPHVFTGVDMTGRASMPANMLSGPSFAPSLQAPGIDRHGFVQSRMVAEPIPGPLPSPGYSFGGPPPDFAGFSFGENADTEDESTSLGSYDPWSRIGSIASTSSTTSACYSEVDSSPEIPAPQGWNPEARRESFASSEQFSSLVSRLDLSQGRRASNGDIRVDTGRPVPYAHRPSFTGEVEKSNNAEYISPSSTESTADYPSPSSTVLPDADYQSESLVMGELRNSSSQSLPISGCSELAHALHANSEPNLLSYPSHAAAVSIATPAPYVVRSYSDGHQSHTSASFTNPTICDQATSANDLSIDTYSGQSYYQNEQGPNARAQIPHAQVRRPSYIDASDQLELHHAMEFQNSGFVDRAVDMSHVTSVVDALHTPTDNNLFMQFL